MRAGRRGTGAPVAEVETPWWRADVLADRRPFLEARGRIVQAIRAFFAADGFVEVETPILQRSPGNEVHLAAFATERVAPDGRRDRLYLHTSPEFACKKLVAGGIPKHFTLARFFRYGERGRLVLFLVVLLVIAIVVLVLFAAIALFGAARRRDAGSAVGGICSGAAGLNNDRNP